jgi:predicted ABC-type ATPase
MRREGLIRLANWRLQLTGADLAAFARQADAQRLPEESIGQLQVQNNVLSFGQVAIDSYLAAWVAELLRYHLLQSGQSLLFETVMSHPSKLDFLAEAHRLGYRVYLYFVATVDPHINIERVQARVAKGGHNVSVTKIEERYYRSLALVRQALQYTDRAYLFDNSGTEPQLMAEITAGQEVQYLVAEVPQWVSQILS